MGTSAFERARARTGGGAGGSAFERARRRLEEDDTPEAPKPSLGERVRRGVEMATNANPIAAAGRTMLADVVATVPRVVSGIAGLQADYLERDTPKRSLSSLITGKAPETPGIVGDMARTYRRVGDAAGDIANRVEEWGRPRNALGTGAKLLTGIGKYAAMGPVAGVAVGAAEAAADPRFSQTSLVAELEKIQRPGMLGNAARAVGRGASWLNETEVGRAVGDVVIGEVGSRVLTSTARGLAKAGGAAERTAARALDRLNPIPDDVIEAATREGLPSSGRITRPRVDPFAEAVAQPPQVMPLSPWQKRLRPGTFEMPARTSDLTAGDDSWRQAMRWEEADRPVMPRGPDLDLPVGRPKLLPERAGGAWAMPGETPETLGEAGRRMEREAREAAMAKNPVRDAMLSRAERVAADPPTSDDVLREMVDRERGTDDLFRLEGGARTPGGARRPVNRVRTDDLINELLDLDAKRVNASGRAQYAWVDDSDNLHYTGTVVPSAKRGADGVSRQAKALQNLEDFKRIEAEITGELQARGLTDDDIYERLRARDEAVNGEARASHARRIAAQRERAEGVGGADPVARAEMEARTGPEPDYQVGDGEGFEHFSVGSTPAFLAATKRVLQSPAGSAAAGAAIGATVDRDNPTRGALAGAAIGAGASVLVKRAAKSGAPLRLTGDADVDAVLGTIARGERTKAKPDGLLSPARKAYTALVDQLYPLRAFGRDIGGSERLADVATQASGWRSSAGQTLREGLKPILEATADNREPVMALAKAQRALALLDAGLEKTDIPRDVLERTVQKLSADPAVSDAARQLQDYYRELLEYKRANGVLTQEAFDAIEATGDVYTPFVREFDDAAGKAPTAGGGRFVNRGTGVRKMDEGIARAKTVDPFEQAVLDTFEAHRTVAKQRVSNVLAELVEGNDIAAFPYVRRVANQQAGRQGRVVAANIKGERQFFEVVDEDIYNAWASFDPQQQNILVTLMAPFKRALQTGVTLLPDFAAANALRDNVMTGLQYPLKYKSAAAGAVTGAAIGAATSDDPGKGALVGAGLGLGVGGLAPNIARSLKAMRSIVKDDAVYRQWLKDGGGGFGGFYPRDPEGARKLMKELEGGGVKASDIINPKRWVDALHYVGRVAEQSPRLAAYTDALGAGADAAGAVAKSADISLDFGKVGTHTKGVAAVTAFWNAKVQGWDKLARMLKSPKTWAQGAAMITAPSVALWAVNKDNPEYWERPQWERNLFWLIPKGGDAGGFWRIPKPFEVGYIFASIPERILDYAHEKDPEALAVAMRDMVSTAAEGSVPLIPTAAQPLVENAANFSFFRNRPVVSRPELAPERQFDDRTSSAAVLAGRATGTSPQQIDNVIAGYTGGAGKIALDVTDRIARAMGLDKRPLPPDRAKVPVVGDLGRRFSTRDGGTSDSEALFWRRWDRADEAYRTVADMAKDGESPDDIRAFILSRKDDLVEYETLKEVRQQLQEVKKAERQVLADRAMPRERKREVQLKLRQLATQIAQGSARGDALAEQDR